MHSAEIKRLIKSDFKSIADPKELTQYLSGKLYFFIDQMLSEDLDKRGDLTIEKTHSFMRLVFEMIFKWMSLIPHLVTIERAPEDPDDDMPTHHQAMLGLRSEFLRNIAKLFRPH